MTYYLYEGLSQDEMNRALNRARDIASEITKGAERGFEILPRFPGDWEVKGFIWDERGLQRRVAQYEKGQQRSLSVNASGGQDDFYKLVELLGLSKPEPAALNHNRP